MGKFIRNRVARFISSSLKTRSVLVIGAFVLFVIVCVWNMDAPPKMGTVHLKNIVEPAKYTPAKSAPKVVVPAKVGPAKSAPKSVVRGKVTPAKSAPKPGKSTVSHSQYGQDQWIYDHYFKNQKRGTFVELGAFDGKLLSNTLLFEELGGWTGLCIEATPFLYEKLVKNRPKCYNVHAAVGANRGKATLRMRNSGGYGGVKELTGPNLDYWFNKSTEIEVDMIPLSDILSEAGVDVVDYFSLDIEGAECHVLKALDWSKVNVRVWEIETDESRRKNDECKCVRDIMKAQGYRLDHKFAVDDVFVKNDFVPQN
eukprot:63179_1